MADQKEWDSDGVPLKDSNCANIGSDEDKAARKSAAQAEPAWRSAGKRAGLEVWRIENFEVKPWPKKKYGSFHKGDSYIVLHTVKSSDTGDLVHQIHFWLGEKTSTDEMGTAAYKTVELDDLFDGEPTEHREVMGFESAQFRELFPKLTYLEGGVDSGFRKSATDVYESRLLHVRKTAEDGMRVNEVPRQRSSLNQGDCFVLDAGLVIYVWEGKQSSAFEKHKANLLAEELESEREGHAKATHDLDARFWELLGGEGPIRGADEADKAPEQPPSHEPVLFCASDASGSLRMQEVGRGKLDASMLKSQDVMILDAFTELFVWVGRGASVAEGRSAMRLAMDFLAHNQKPKTTPIHLFKEGQSIHNAHWRELLGGGKSGGGAGAGGGANDFLKCFAICCGS
mmetsp:Transcript_3837/g.11308  ORF Transcript_3837/g.11308 Transcript_3837/m.11308 type:complete len:399 (-) Transcript_3837:9-1205(-)